MYWLRFLIIPAVALAVLGDGPAKGVTPGAGGASIEVPFGHDRHFLAEIVTVHGTGAAGAAEDAVIAAARTSQAFAEIMTRWESAPEDVVVRWGEPSVGSQGDRWVVLTRSSPKLMEELAALPDDTELRIGAPSGQQETETIVGSAIEYLRASGTVVAARSSYDLESMHPVIAIEVTPGIDRTSLEAAVRGAWATVARSLGRDLVDGEVQFREAAGLSGRRGMTTVEGGRALWYADGSAIACTSGFSATRNGIQGLVTAQHCANNLTYRNVAGVIAFAANATGSGSALVDLQFMRTTTGNGAGPYAYFGSGGVRSVNAVANAGIYSTPCKFGMYGGYDCGYIIGQNECFTYSSHTWCGQDESFGSHIAAGDSGGPWATGNTANGISASSCGSCTDTFTRISRVPSSLGAAVKKAG